MAEKTKYYPKATKDQSGLKFYCDIDDKHITMRFAGNPLFVLEYTFKRLGGKDFNGTYEDAKK